MCKVDLWHCGPLRGVLCILALSLSLLANADAVAGCNSVTINGKPLYVNDEVLRQAALAFVNSQVNETNRLGPLRPVTPPNDPVRCTGADARIPDTVPTAQDYYGNVTSKQKFMRLVLRACMGQDNANQYFSMNRAIYVRRCGGGDYSNYIFFWGLQDSNPSQCFGSDYPTMYALANKNKKSPVTVSKMAAVYGKSGLDARSQEGYALGNAMAAILVSESARDYLVILENYMLMDLAGASAAKPDEIIGGRCVPNAASCQNPKSPQNGVHPIAWGGAKEAMMKRDWGVASGATSDFGMEFEGELVTKWARKFKAVSEAKAGQCPAPPVTYDDLTPEQQSYLRNLFSSLLK
ncbi:hypothetical protein ACLKMY_24880 [Paraburkholderia mimosarum]|uniref:hypothetical protein n=1 Tax=Paraburkholderia mimosarum TaxID=312026 RepID=UPI0039C47EE4